MRGLLKGVALAAALAVPAWAASAPTLSEEAGEAEIEAWIADYVVPGSQMRGVSYAAGVEYYDPRELQKQTDGHVLALLRLEYWRPQREGHVTWRSERQKVEVDCATNRIRFVSIDTYPANNLQGRPTPLALDGNWTDPIPEDDENGPEVRQICSFASLLGTPDSESGAPPPVASVEEASAWFARYAKLGADVLLAHDGLLTTYYSPPDLERLADGNVRGWVRRELAAPMVLGNSGVRSSRMQYEVDCAHRRYRTVDLIVFPGQNLTGAPNVDFSGQALPPRAIQAGSDDAPILRALCALAADPNMPVVDAIRPPKVPFLDGGDQPAVGAWIKAHLNTAGYVLSSYDSSFVILYEPGTLALAGRSVVALTVRRETVGAPRAGNKRSMLFDMEVDCQGRRIRIVSSSFFADANLEGEREDLGGQGWWRMAKGSHEERLAEKICPLRDLLAQDIDLAAALIPPPVSTDEEDVVAWVAEHVRPMDYVYVDHNDDVVVLHSWNEGERTRQGSIRVWTRFEYFDPRFDETVYRSMRRLMEYDCDQGRSRLLADELYPGANLTGKAVKHQHGSADWSFVLPSTLESRLADAVCELGDAADAAAEDAVSAPRLPRAGAASPL